MIYIILLIFILILIGIRCFRLNSSKDTYHLSDEEIKRKIKDDPDKSKKIREALAGEEDKELTIDGKTYRVRKIDIYSNNED